MPSDSSNVATYCDLLTSRQEEESSLSWDPFHIDVEKILHANAYARYADKTQVVYLFHHDHIAYRGLHVQLVSSLARAIGRKLNLSLDLIEAISLGHDIGHTPFGHEGEKYLSEISQEAGLGAFSHSRQSCRVAMLIEPLNLTLATLDGFLCHDGAMDSSLLDTAPSKGWKEFNNEVELRLHQPEADLLPITQEAALVKLSDTISYVERDLNDAITLGIIRVEEVPKGLFEVDTRKMSSEIARDLIQTFKRTGKIGLSEEVFFALKETRDFNFDRIYFHKGLKTESQKIKRAYQLLFKALLKEWKNRGKESLLWTHFLHNRAKSYIEGCSHEAHVIDYIAGMTDGYFLRLFHELFVPTTIKVPHVLPFS
jgi:dGTPase